VGKWRNLERGGKAGWEAGGSCGVGCGWMVYVFWVEMDLKHLKHLKPFVYQGFYVLSGF